MALLVEKGTWSGSGSSPQTITLADSNITPIAIICFTTGPGAAGFTDSSSYSIGFGTRRGGSTQSGCIGWTAIDNVATSDCARVRNTTLLHVLADTTTTDYTVSLDSFGAGQFVVSYSSAANASGDTFHYIVFGGADLTDAIVLNWTMDSVGATEVVTGAGFQPSALFALDSDLVIADSITAEVAVSFGFASSSSLFTVMGKADTDGDTMTSTMRYNRTLYNNGCLVRHTINADTVDAKWDLDSFDSDGCTLGVVDAPTNTDRIATLLFIKGGTWEAGTKLKNTGTGNETFTLANSSLTPKAVILVGNQNGSINAFDVGSSTFYLGAGTSTDGTKEGTAISGTAEAINTRADRHWGTTKVFTGMSIGATPALTYQADLIQMNAGNFVVDWTQNDGFARAMGFLVCGDTPPAAGLDDEGFMASRLRDNNLLVTIYG